MPRNRAAMRRRAERQASPFLCFRPPFRRPLQKGWGLALPLYSHERTTIIQDVGKKMTTNPTRQVSNKATPARANKEKINAHDTGGCGDSRKTTAPGRPASQFWQRPGRGRAQDHPRCARCRRRKECGDARCAPARLRWAGAAGAHRDGRATQSCGGSRGPADPWSAAAASKRRDLWFFQS